MYIYCNCLYFYIIFTCYIWVFTYNFQNIYYFISSLGNFLRISLKVTM